MSEMAAIRNLHWWTVEYGLIGSVTDFRIYGAGLLSSIGESKWCLSDQVQKLPYTIAAAQQHFDYTKPQPQLFVTPDFAHLSTVLEEHANTMAVRTGGLAGVVKLIDSGQLGTIELSTGIQISGRFKEVIADQHNHPVYVITEGPSALAYREKELMGHGPEKHASGFGTALGPLKGINLPIEDMSPRDLEAYDIYEGRQVVLEFLGGIEVCGRVITGIRNLQGKIILIRFSDCRVSHGQRLLFKPADGIYDMAVGRSIVSAFAGPADPGSFELCHHRVSPPHRPEALSERAQRRIALYEVAHKWRTDGSLPNLESHVSEAIDQFATDWLLLVNLWQSAYSQGREGLAQRLKSSLERLKFTHSELSHLIGDLRPT